MIEVASPPEVSVSFAPRQLGRAAQWRYVLRRLYPRAAAPIRAAAVRSVLFVIYLGFVGVFLGMVGQVTRSPLPLGVAGLILGLLWPLRLWRIKRASLGLWRDVDATEVELGPVGVTARSPYRTTTVRWAGVADLAVTPREVVLRFRAGDVVSVPVAAFRDDDHLGQFVTRARSSLVAAAAAPGLVGAGAGA